MTTYKKIEDWLQPIPYNVINLPSFDITIFPDWIKEYIEAVAEETQVPIDAVAFAAISLLSTIISGVYEVKPNETSWKEVLSIFSVVGLAPANRKSAVFSLFLKTLIQVEKNLKAELKTKIADIEVEKKQVNKQLVELEKKHLNTLDSAQAEEILNEIKQLNTEIEKLNSIMPVMPNFFVSDVTPEKLAELLFEQNGVFAILSSEGAELFDMVSSRYSNNSSIDVYLKGFSGESIRTSRKNGTAIDIEKAVLTIGLFVQNSIIQELPVRLLNRGLMQRFLFCTPQSLVGRRKIETKPIPLEVNHNFEINIKKLTEKSFYGRVGKLPTIELTFSEEAREYLKSILFDVEKALANPDINDSFKEWIGKLVGQIIRLSGLIHVAENISKDNVPLIIEKHTLENVDTLRPYLMLQAEFAFNLINQDTNISELDYIISKIIDLVLNNQEYIGMQLLWQKVKKKFKTKKSLNKYLTILEDLDYIKVEKVGRKEIILVNPYLIKNAPNSPNQ